MALKRGALWDDAASGRPPGCSGYELREDKKEYHWRAAEQCKEQTFVHTMGFHPVVKEEMPPVKIEMPNFKRESSPVTLASLRPNALNPVNLGGRELTPPVTFQLTSGSGPGYLSGQHFMEQNDCKSEEENNSSPIKRPFKHETSKESVHPIKKKLKPLQYDDVSETDSDHDDDDDDESDVCEVPMPPPEIVDLTDMDGEESNSRLAESDDESSSDDRPMDILQKVMAWNQKRKYLEAMTKQTLESMKRAVDLNQDNPFLPDPLKDGKCTEQNDKKSKKSQKRHKKTSFNCEPNQAAAKDHDLKR
ncbi:uncharacterized protein LOC144771531 [Lissotriton helveticus]